MILVPTVKHSGTNYILDVLGGTRTRLTGTGRIDDPDADILWTHFDKRTPYIPKNMKTVIPLRHPMLIAISWKKRGKTGWLKEWMRMCEMEAFHFPLHSKPFRNLAQYTGRELNIHDTALNSLGNYPEKEDLKTALRFLDKQDLCDVVDALDTPIGSEHYDSDLRWI